MHGVLGQWLGLILMNNNLEHLSGLSELFPARQAVGTGHGHEGGSEL